MLIFSAICSVILIAVVFAAYRSEGKPIGGAAAMAVGGALVGAALLQSLFLHSILVLLGLFVWKFVWWSARTLLIYSFLAALGPYTFFGYLAVEQWAEIHRLRQEYAFESMESRVPAPTVRLPVDRLPVVENELKELAQEIGNDGEDFRAIMLHRLHVATVDDFVNRPGFGVGRRIRPTERTLKVNLQRPDEPVPQPKYMPQSTLSEADLQDPRLLSSEALRKLHMESVVDFANPRGFGLIVNRNKVAGFQPHQFGMVPQAKEWKVESIELVGLLKHEEPVVYLSESLPKMDELRTAPTRSLNAFEVAALKKISDGDNLFVREHSPTMLMFGAIRSVEQCQKCHGGEPGDLLGAFSYRLAPTP